MPIRVTLIVVACLALVAARALGLHSHISHWDDDELAELQVEADHHGVHEHITVAESDGAAGHLDSHLDHGDIDLDEPAIAAGKLSILKAPIALIAFVCALLVLIPVLKTAALPPPRRPPKYRSRPHLLPPSQAPPIAA